MIARAGVAIARRLTALAAAAVVAASIVSLAGRHGWWLDLFSHFRVHYVVAAALLAVLSWRSHRLVPFALLVATAINVAALVPRTERADAAPAGDPAPALRVVALNLYYRHRYPERAERFLLEVRPDVAVLTEYTAAWHRALARFRADYRCVLTAPRHHTFGIAFYARAACRGARVVDFGDVGFPATTALIEVNGTQWRIVGVHLMPPWSHKDAAVMTRQLDGIAAHLAAGGGPRVLAGDLNMTPWTYRFADLKARAGLRDVGRHVNLESTFPAPVSALGLPIDHILTSPEIIVSRRWVGPHVGSDHFPVIADLVSGTDASAPRRR